LFNVVHATTISNDRPEIAFFLQQATDIDKS
jgi:hypothetical protein